MINETESMSVLNSDGTIFKKDEMKLIRDLLVTLATIEYESKQQFNNQ